MVSLDLAGIALPAAVAPLPLLAPRAPALGSRRRTTGQETALQAPRCTAPAAGVALGAVLAVLGVRRAPRTQRAGSGEFAWQRRRVAVAQAAGNVQADELVKAERYLRVRLYDAALAALEGCGGSRASVLRAAALAGLREYAAALREVEGADSIATGFDAEELRAGIARLQRQAETGDFPFEEVYNHALAAAAAGADPAAAPSVTLALLPRFADYGNAVEVVKTEKGRGLAITRDVIAGEVLLVCNALALSREGVPGQPDPMAVELYHVTAASGHASRLCRECLADGSGNLGQVTLEDFLWRRGASDDSAALSDEKLTGISQTNTFEELGICVLYPTVALVNHSCVPNALLVSVGHTTFLRACRAMRAGTEVEISYFDTLMPLGAREQRTKSWNFKCGCPRCAFERTLPEKLHQEVPATEVEDFIKDFSNGVDVASIECQWLRASHAKTYKTDLENAFPLSADAGMQRDRFLRATEATAPASFTHLKYAWLDWLLKGQKAATPRGDRPPDYVILAARYVDMVLKARYGPMPNSRVDELLKHTGAAMASAGVGTEFCNPKATRLIPPSAADALVPAAPASAAAGSIGGSGAGGAGMVMLD